MVKRIETAVLDPNNWSGHAFSGFRLGRRKMNVKFYM